MGLSTIGGAFTPEILTRMSELNARPVIFPLSNPSSQSECTFADAMKYTKSTCLFASGSPFPDYEGQTPGQGNNMYGKSAFSPAISTKPFYSNHPLLTPHKCSLASVSAPSSARPSTSRKP